MGRIYLQSGLALAFNSLLMLIPAHSKNSEYRAILSAEKLASKQLKWAFFLTQGWTPRAQQSLGHSRCQPAFI